MKNECSIVKDLLPLYAEGMTSKETDEWIEEHLQSCEECRKELAEIHADTPAEDKKELPLKQFSVTYQKKRRELFILAAAAACTILLSIFSFLSAPQFLDAKEAVASVYEEKDTVIVQFTDKVRHYSAYASREPDSDEVSYTIQCWTTAYDQMFEKDNAYAASFAKSNIWYANNRSSFDSKLKGDEGDTLLFGETDGGRITLRRLTLNYYLLLSAGLSAIFLIIWLLNRNQPAGSTVFDIFMIPFSWLCASVIVGRGFGNATFSLTRDLILIVLLAVSILITGRLALKYRREQRAATGAQQ